MPSTWQKDIGKLALPSSQSLILEYMAPAMRTRRRRRIAREKLGVHGRRCALYDPWVKMTRK